jgi:hypothetical protein
MPPLHFLALFFIAAVPNTLLTESDTPLIPAELIALDHEFDGCFAWWGNVYDPLSGGCFYGLSGKQAAADGDKAFGPDIEATSKLVNVLEWTGLIDQVDPTFKAGIISYMQSRQDPKTGFFRDPQFIDSYSPVTLDRAVGMASGSLRRCGSRPLYPMPIDLIGENDEATQHYAHLASPEAVTTWLEALPWKRRIWTVGGTINAQSGIFKTIAEPLRSELLTAAEMVFAAHQADDGYFGAVGTSDAWYSRLSGTYKIMSFLEQNGRDIPKREAVTATLLHDLEHRRYDNLIVLYNTANLLGILQRQGANFSPAKRLELVARCTAIIADFHASDGGFMTQRDNPSPSANGKTLGKEVIEGNTNATGLAHKTRSLLYELVIGENGPCPHGRSQDLIQTLHR